MTDYKKEFLKCLESIDYTRRRFDVFQDFLTLSTISLANVVLQNDKLEKQYFEIIKRYKKPEKLAELLTIITLALEEKITDFLGEVYMFGNFSEKKCGQFFTPYHISQFISEIIFDERIAKQTIEEQGFIKLSEPCCGSGGMILSFAETMLKYNLNPQKQMIFQGIDVDINCCRMSFIQTSLLGLTGEIIHGDTILLNCWQVFVTPMTILNMNNYLRFREYQKGYIKEDTPNKFLTKDFIQLKLLGG